MTDVISTRGKKYSQPPLWWNPNMLDCIMNDNSISGDRQSLMIKVGSNTINISMMVEATEQSWILSWSGPEYKNCHDNTCVTLSSRHLKSAFGIESFLDPENGGDSLKSHYGACAGHKWRYMRAGNYLTFPGPYSVDFPINPLPLLIDDYVKDIVGQLCFTTKD